MAGHDIAGWGNFLLATAGAAGALAGLVFVALSINLSRILDSPGVSGRAAETLIVLGAALIAALIGLMPGLTVAALGWCLLVVGAATWGVPTWIQLRTVWKGEHYRRSYAVLRFTLHHVATLPLMLGGVSLVGWFGGGMYLVAAGLMALLVVAMVNGWVLLVEILR